MRRPARGFTLVELMIVIVLVGILSVIAVVGYRKWVASTHKAEATSIISGIAASEEAYNAERGTYVNVSGRSSNYYPASTPGPFKTAWGGPCSGCFVEWSTLGFHPSDPVLFGYSVTTSAAATTGKTKIFVAGKPPATGPFYLVTAVADSDGDGVFATALYHSDSKVITIDAEGE